MKRRRYVGQLPLPFATEDGGGPHLPGMGAVIMPPNPIQNRERRKRRGWGKLPRKRGT